MTTPLSREEQIKKMAKAIHDSDDHLFTKQRYALKTVNELIDQTLKAFADEVEKLIDRQEKVNLQLHGRPDCKSCSLAESIQALLEKRGNERSKSF